MCAGAVSLASFTAPLSGSAMASSSPAIGCAVVHFEVGCKDLEKTTVFFIPVFLVGHKHRVLMRPCWVQILPALTVDKLLRLGMNHINILAFYIQVENITETL